MEKNRKIKWTSDEVKNNRLDFIALMVENDFKVSRSARTHEVCWVYQKTRGGTRIEIIPSRNYNQFIIWKLKYEDRPGYGGRGSVYLRKKYELNADFDGLINYLSTTFQKEI